MGFMDSLLLMVNGEKHSSQMLTSYAINGIVSDT